MDCLRDISIQSDIMIKVRVINSAYQSELGAIVCPPKTVTDK